MVNIYTTIDTGSMVIWPESGSNTTSSLSMELTNDMNKVSGSFTVYKINNPDNLSEYLVLEYYSGSGIPTASGQYSYIVKEDDVLPYKWGDAAFKFASASFTFGSGTAGTGSAVIDSGRAYVYGTNDPTFTNYTTNNENGAYITYYTG